MSKYRTAYAPGFRQQLIELVHAGRSANDVVKEFGLHATTVVKWVRLSSMGTSVAMGQWPEIMFRKGRAWPFITVKVDNTHGRLPATKFRLRKRGLQQ